MKDNKQELKEYVAHMAISHIRQLELTQSQAAKIIQVDQPRVSALVNKRFDAFRLDNLIDLANRLGVRFMIKKI